MFMPPKEIDLSVVVPLYNEESNVLPLYNQLRPVLEGLGKEWELILIDDGSRDRTFFVARELKKQESRVKVVKFRKNFGQTAAFAAGFEYSKGRIIVTMDGDLQNDPRDIPLLLGKMKEGYDVVCGWRKNRRDRLMSRKIPSWFANWLIRLNTRVRVHDYGCSLKVFRGRVVKALHMYSDMHRFLPAIATPTGASVAEVVVNHRLRKFGKSKYGIFRTFNVLFDLIVIRMLIGFAAKPSHWFGIMSIPFLLLSFFFLFISFVNHHHLFWSRDFVISEDIPVIFPSLSILFFFLFIHFLALGLLGELVLKSEEFNPIKPIVAAMEEEEEE